MHIPLPPHHQETVCRGYFVGHDRNSFYSATLFINMRNDKLFSLFVNNVILIISVIIFFSVFIIQNAYMFSVAF